MITFKLHNFNRKELQHLKGLSGQPRRFDIAEFECMDDFYEFEIAYGEAIGPGRSLPFKLDHLMNSVRDRLEDLSIKLQAKKDQVQCPWRETWSVTTSNVEEGRHDGILRIEGVGREGKTDVVLFEVST